MVIGFGNITNTAMTGSSILNFALWRNSSSSIDDCGESAWLMSFDIHYMKDSLGSRGQYGTK